MSASWIVYGLLVGALLAAAARGIEEVCRLAGRPTRWVWATALALTVALAGVAPRREAATPRLAVPAEVARSVVEAPVKTGASWWDATASALASARLLAEGSLRGALAAVERHAPRALDRWLAGLWAAASVAILLFFAAVYARFRWARRGWPVADLQGTRVRIAPGVGPAVVGLSRPEIVVPRWLLSHTVEEQRLVLAHEEEHLLARDPLLLAAACAAAVLLPWHPAVWWMLSRLRLAVELDCDRRVLHRGVPPLAYGTLLIDLAGRCSGMRVGAPALADEPSHLERRLLAMMPNFSRLALARTCAAGSVALLALVAACEAKLPTSAELDRMDVVSAEQGMRRMEFAPAGDSLMVFTVDGKQVAAAEARALPAERIGEVAVERSRTPGGVSHVRITTREATGQPAGGPTKVRVGGPGASFRMRSDGGSSFTGVVLLDGARVEESALRTLSPDRIASVRVIKGDEATKLYDAPEAKNGVIVITTKGGTK